MIIWESIAAALRTARHSQKDERKAAKTRLQNLRSQLSAALGEGFSKNTPDATLIASPASLQPSSPLFLAASLSATPHAIFARSWLLWSKYPAKTKSRLKLLAGQSLAKFKSLGDETSSQRTKKKVASKDHRKSRGQAPTPQKSLPSLSTSEVSDLDKYRLREELKAVPCSVLLFFGR